MKEKIDLFFSAVNQLEQFNNGAEDGKSLAFLFINETENFVVIFDGTEGTETLKNTTTVSYI